MSCLQENNGYSPVKNPISRGFIHIKRKKTMLQVNIKEKEKQSTKNKEEKEMNEKLSFFSRKGSPANMYIYSILYTQFPFVQ